MTIAIDGLWVSANPALEMFHEPLLQQLSQQQTIACWQYQQTMDEPISLDGAVELLDCYLQSQDRPLHLMGHSTGGLLALLYARQYPQRVRSLTLLGVGVHPAVDWQAHFYVLRQLLSCNREIVLTQMVRNLFGKQYEPKLGRMIKMLAADLNNSLSPHTLWQRVSIPEGGVSMPMLICGGEEDVIVDPHLLESWQPWLKVGDRLWHCPQGKHFFHHAHPKLVSEQILEFWSPAKYSRTNLMTSGVTS
jgi:pimeloyl-ACP methyl ester carboxylesterase